MDLLGYLQAVLAIAVFPGGLFLGAAAWLVRRAGGLRGDAGLSPAAVGALAACAVAVALLPLPGSPVGSLPPTAGAAPNLVVAVVLLAAALALRWCDTPGSGQRPGAVLVLLAVAGLAAASATLALPTITTNGGAFALGARAAAAATLVLLTPVLAAPHGAGSVAVRATLTAALLIAAACLLAPAYATVTAGVVTGAATLAGVAVVGMAFRISRWRPLTTLLTRAGAVAAAVSLALAVAAAR